MLGAASVEQLDARRAAAGRVVARDLEELAAVRAEEQELDVEQARRKEALAHALDFGSQVALADVAEASGLQRRQGRLPRPVAGAIVGGFGPHKDPQTGLMLARRGVEMRSHAGEPVRAIASGRVRFIGDVPGLGRGVAIDHGDGYVTLTAQLGELRCAVGDEVGDGDVVALAGGPNVYFELAQQSTPMDPTRWLARGQSLTFDERLLTSVFDVDCWRGACSGVDCWRGARSDDRLLSITSATIFPRMVGTSGRHVPPTARPDYRPLRREVAACSPRGAFCTTRLLHA